jgi:hypothetical protein
VTRFAAAKDPAKAVVAVAGIDPKSADSGQRAGYRPDVEARVYASK